MIFEEFSNEELSRDEILSQTQHGKHTVVDQSIVGYRKLSVNCQHYSLFDFFGFKNRSPTVDTKAIVSMEIPVGAQIARSKFIFSDDSNVSTRLYTDKLVPRKIDPIYPNSMYWPFDRLTCFRAVSHHSDINCMVGKDVSMPFDPKNSSREMHFYLTKEDAMKEHL